MLTTAEDECAQSVGRKGALASLPAAFDGSRILNVQQMAELYGVSVATIRRMYRRGTLPGAVRIGERRIGWRAKDALAAHASLPAA
jgi:predicted DNA-binding transcriptional regulator AlpA